MSLVNDMLRDLDRRRQEPTPSGLGAERLVPVGSRPAKKDAKFSLFTFAVTIAITLSLIMAFLYFRQAALVTTTPMQPVFTPAPVVTAVQESVQATVIDSQELEIVTQRMQELETQNRALLAAQENLNLQAQEVEQARMALNNSAAELAEARSTTTQPNSIAQASAAVDQVDALVIENNNQAASNIAAVNAPAVSTSVESASTIRSPRELSFAEQDQLQSQDAMRLVANNQRDQAARQLLIYLGENPNAHQSRETLIKLALQGGDMNGAQTLLDAGLRVAPTRDAFRKLQARLYLSGGQSADAVQILSTRMPSVSDDFEFHDLMATAYLSTQDFANAAKTYEALVQQNRGEARWWYGLATSWDSLGRNRDATLAYEQALKLPNLSASLRQRSQVRLAEIGN